MIDAQQTNEQVVTGSAEELVISRAPSERIIAGAAVEVGLRQRSVGFVEGDGFGFQHSL